MHIEPSSQKIPSSTPEFNIAHEISPAIRHLYEGGQRPQSKCIHRSNIVSVPVVVQVYSTRLRLMNHVPPLSLSNILNTVPYSPGHRIFLKVRLDAFAPQEIAVFQPSPCVHNYRAIYIIKVHNCHFQAPRAPRNSYHPAPWPSEFSSQPQLSLQITNIA